jgi:hypothetical protein
LIVWWRVIIAAAIYEFVAVTCGADFAQVTRRLAPTAVIHPSHVKIANAALRPTEQEVAHYEGLRTSDSLGDAPDRA